MSDAALIQFLVEALPGVSSDLVYRTVRDNPGADATELLDVLTAMQSFDQPRRAGAGTGAGSGSPGSEGRRRRRLSSPAAAAAAGSGVSSDAAPAQGSSAADPLLIPDEDGATHYAIVPIDAAVAGSAVRRTIARPKTQDPRAQLTDQAAALRSVRADRWAAAGGKRPKEGQASHGAKRTAWQEVQDLRKEEHKKWREDKRTRKRVWTVKDLEEMQSFADDTAAGAWSSSNDDRFMRIGKEALRLTNEFRREHKLPPLAWHDGLGKIGEKHCENMARGDVPIGHAGFDERVRAYPMSHSAAGENVAMSQGMDNVAKVAVDGWINSPGHRRNLLGTWTHCGIGVTQGGNSAYYLTQMFALAN